MHINFVTTPCICNSFLAYLQAIARRLQLTQKLVNNSANLPLLIACHGCVFSPCMLLHIVLIPSELHATECLACLTV